MVRIIEFDREEQTVMLENDAGDNKMKLTFTEWAYLVSTYNSFVNNSIKEV